MRSDKLDVADVERRLSAAFQAKDEALVVQDFGDATEGFTHQRDGRRVRLLLPACAAAIVLLLVGAYGLIALVRSSAPPHSAELGGSSSQTVETDASTQTIGRLWAMAEMVARADNATIKAAEAVKTSAERSERFLLGSSSSGDTTQATWAVQAETTSGFTCCGSVPSGRHPSIRPDYRFILMSINATTFEEMAGGVSIEGKDLSRLGKVITLRDTGAASSSAPPAPAEVQTSITNSTQSPATVLGCPRCNGADGAVVGPGQTLHWTERRLNAHYAVLIEGRRASCQQPPAPRPGAMSAINYRITARDHCVP